MNPRLTDPRLLDHRDFERVSGLPFGHFDRPWFTRPAWRWTAIVLLILALIGAALTGSDLPSY